MWFAAMVTYIAATYFQHFKVINFDNLKPFFIFNNLCHIAFVLWAGCPALLLFGIFENLNSAAINVFTDMMVTPIRGY